MALFSVTRRITNETERHLRYENANLLQDLVRLCGLAGTEHHGRHGLRACFSCAGWTQRHWAADRRGRQGIQRGKMTRTVAEWIGKTPDEKIPPRVRLRVF